MDNLHVNISDIESFSNYLIISRITMVSKERLMNLYNKCLQFNNTCYSFVECGVAAGGCLALMKKYAGPNNLIIGFDSFDGMPELSSKDINLDYNKSDPIAGFGKPGDNLSGGIDNVINNFKLCDLNFDNVILVKGYFSDSFQNPNNIKSIGEIAILRLDGDWYESTKICLEKLYDSVIVGGVIIIDDYGHWVGAKTATDEFRTMYNIESQLIQTDYTEHYWVKTCHRTT